MLQFIFRETNLKTSKPVTRDFVDLDQNESPLNKIHVNQRMNAHSKRYV